LDLSFFELLDETNPYFKKPCTSYFQINNLIELEKMKRKDFQVFLEKLLFINFSGRIKLTYIGELYIYLSARENSEQHFKYKESDIRFPSDQKRRIVTLEIIDKDIESRYRKLNAYENRIFYLFPNLYDLSKNLFGIDIVHLAASMKLSDVFPEF
tara:strand:- start:34 stop:498 length:465 start_codon:yes stop_codon:yes gene_type:complete